MAKKQTKKQEQEPKTDYGHAGQSAEEFELHFTKLSDTEKKIVRRLGKAGRPILSIEELVEKCGLADAPPSERNPEFCGWARGNSMIRNALRRLVPSGWVENVEERGSGLYQLTVPAASRLRRLKSKRATKKTKSSKKGAQAQASA